MKKELLKTISFWIGIVLLSIPILTWFIEGFYIQEQDYFHPWLREGLHWSPDYFFELIYQEEAVPFVLLFGVGSALVVFSIFNQKITRKRSVFAIVAGALVWVYLIVNIFTGEWWWLNWFLLAIFGSALMVFGIRNIVEK